MRTADKLRERALAFATMGWSDDEAVSELVEAAAGRRGRNRDRTAGARTHVGICGSRNGKQGRIAARSSTQRWSMARRLIGVTATEGGCRRPRRYEHLPLGRSPGDVNGGIDAASLVAWPNRLEAVA